MKRRDFLVLLLSIFALGFFGYRRRCREAARVRTHRHRERARRRQVDGAVPGVLQPVGCRGLGATTSVHQKNKIAAWRIREIVDAYAQGARQPRVARAGFPERGCLRAVIVEGRPDFGMHAVGKGMDSPGSELLIKSVDRQDPRPLWVPVWGGPNVLRAGAVESARHALGQGAAAVRREAPRLHDLRSGRQRPVDPQDFPELFYIASPGIHAGGAYHYSTWSGISGDKFHGRFAGADFSIVDNPWLDENIRSKGPLGAQHPHTKFMMEGDTPSFLNLIGNGLSDPEHPDWGGWGGRYEFYTPRMRKWFLEPETRPFWSDAEDEVLGVDGNWHTANQATIWRWRSAFQNDFAARMDWTIKPYAEANHPPVARLAHSEQLTAKAGERVNLSAEGPPIRTATDSLYIWFYYPEAGTLSVATGRTGEPLTIENANARDASFIVPKNVLKPGTMHIILAVTDDGAPALTRYRRVIVTVPAT